MEATRKHISLGIGEWDILARVETIQLVLHRVRFHLFDSVVILPSPSKPWGQQAPHASSKPQWFQKFGRRGSHIGLEVDMGMYACE